MEPAKFPGGSMSGFEAFLIVSLFGSIIFIFVHAARNAPSSLLEPEDEPPKRRPKATPKKRDDSDNASGTIKLFRASGGAFVAKVVPDKLTVHISKTTCVSPRGPIDCWVYASDGFWEVGQREIIFILARREREADGDRPKARRRAILDGGRQALPYLPDRALG